MTTQTIKDLKDLQERIENFSSRLKNKTSNIVSKLEELDLQSLIQKLDSKPVLVKQYIITAQIEDKVVSNKVSTTTLDEFSIQIQFGKLTRNFFRGEEIHEQFSRESGNSVSVLDKDNNVLSLKEYIETEVGDKGVAQLTSEQLILVDRDNVATLFNSFLGTPTTVKRLNEATIIITQLPAQESKVSIQDSVIEDIEDTVIMIESALEESESAFESLEEEFSNLEDTIDEVNQK